MNNVWRRCFAEAVLYIATRYIWLIGWIVLYCAVANRLRRLLRQQKHHRSEICKTLKVQILIVQIQNNAMKDKTSDISRANPTLAPRSEKLCDRNRATCAAQIPKTIQAVITAVMEAVDMPLSKGSGLQDVIQSISCRTSEAHMSPHLGKYQHLSKLIQIYQNLISLDFKRTSSDRSN